MKTANPTLCVSNTIQTTANPTIQFSTIDGTYVMCMVCKKKLLKRSSNTHSCRGAPVNTCVFCKKQFKYSSNLAVHKKRCKQNPINQPEPTDRTPETNGNTIINNTTINNNTVNNTVNNIINIQFGNENIQDLLFQTKYDGRLIAIADKLKEKQEIQSKLKDHELRYKNCKEARHEGSEVEKLKYEILLLKEKHTDDLLHVLLDLVYFNTDIPQNHTIRKTNKKSDMIEIRDNELWNMLPTNSVLQTILNPICQLAQEMANGTNNMFSTKDYSKQNFNDIMYSKTQRGNLNAERILKPFERPLKADESEWRAFQTDVSSTYIPCYGYRRSDLDKYQILSELKDTAEKHGIENFCCYRDGEPIFEEVIKRFPE